MRRQLATGAIVLSVILPLAAFADDSTSVAAPRGAETVKAEREKVKTELKAKRAEAETALKAAREKLQAEFKTRRAENEAEFKAKRQTLEAELKAKRAEAEVQAKALREDIRERLEAKKSELKKKFGEDRLKKIQDFAEKTFERYEEAIDRLNKTADRIEDRLNRLANDGKDVTAEKELLAKARESISGAGAALENGKAKLASALDAKDPQQSFKDVKSILDTVKEALKAAHASLVSVIKTTKPGQLKDVSAAATTTPTASTTSAQ